MNEELNRCKCGGEAIRAEYFGTWQVVCTKCPAHTMKYLNSHEPIVAWNAANPPAQTDAKAESPKSLPAIFGGYEGASESDYFPKAEQPTPSPSPSNCNFINPNHPHGPPEPRWITEDGRCLLCAVSFLESELTASRQENERLTVAVKQNGAAYIQLLNQCEDKDLEIIRLQGRVVEVEEALKICHWHISAHAQSSFQKEIHDDFVLLSKRVLNESLNPALSTLPKTP